MSELLKVQAIHFSDRLKLKEVREKCSVPVLEFSNYELTLQYGPQSYAFIYNYGSIVFFNVPEDVQSRELSRIQELRTQATLASSVPRTTDLFLVEALNEAEASKEVVNRVFFDRVQVSKLNYQKARIISMSLAESTALEYYEILVEELLEQASHFSKKLEKEGKILPRSREAIRFIGRCLSTQQEIISNLYIVDSPDEIWEDSELDRVFKDLKIMLEVDIRYRALEHKIRIVQDSVEIMADLMKSRRDALLELTVIFLIAFEVIYSILGSPHL